MGGEGGQHGEGGLGRAAYGVSLALLLAGLLRSKGGARGCQQSGRKWVPGPHEYLGLRAAYLLQPWKWGIFCEHTRVPGH